MESMTVRTVRLRDLAGDAHFVPFGEIASVRNMSRGFPYAAIRAGAVCDEDVDRVIAKLREVGDALRGDAFFGPDILEPLEVPGLDSFGDSAIDIHARLKTRPARQRDIRCEFNRRMKRAFDEAEIGIPFPQRTATLAQAPAPRGGPREAIPRRRGGPQGGYEGGQEP